MTARRRPIVVDGVVFSSIAEAARALRAPASTLAVVARHDNDGNLYAKAAWLRRKRGPRPRTTAENVAAGKRAAAPPPRSEKFPSVVVPLVPRDGTGLPPAEMVVYGRWGLDMKADIAALVERRHPGYTPATSMRSAET